MNERDKYLEMFVQDLHDLMGMNTNRISQKAFFYKWIDEDLNFIISDDGAEILMDDFIIKVERA